jgi:hypothetical protein
MIVDRFRWRLLAAVLALPYGCGDNTPSPTPVDAPVLLTVDDKVLLALDYYEPTYKVDADGKVINLMLSGRHVTSAAMAEIGKLTDLHGLDLYGASVTDEGLAQLKDLQKLRSIGLGATPMTDKGLIHLEKLQALQWVWLPRKTVSKVGLEKLKEARPDMNVYPQ